MTKSKQLSLFPEPEIVSPSTVGLSEKGIKVQLEDITLKAFQEPLLFGEIGSKKEKVPAEDRLSRILDYLEKKIPADLYLIQYDKKLIGAAYIWDGWLAVEADYTHPSIELAFIDPAYKEYSPLIKTRIVDILDDVLKERY